MPKSANKTCVDAEGAHGEHRPDLPPDAARRVRMAPHGGEPIGDGCVDLGVHLRPPPRARRSPEDPVDVAREHDARGRKRARELDRDRVRREDRVTPRRIGDDIAEPDRHLPPRDRREIRSGIELRERALAVARAARGRDRPRIETRVEQFAHHEAVEPAHFHGDDRRAAPAFDRPGGRCRLGEVVLDRVGVPERPRAVQYHKPVRGGVTELERQSTQYLRAKSGRAVLSGDDAPPELDHDSRRLAHPPHGAGTPRAGLLRGVKRGPAGHQDEESCHGQPEPAEVDPLKRGQPHDREKDPCAAQQRGEHHERDGNVALDLVLGLRPEPVLAHGPASDGAVEERCVRAPSGSELGERSPRHRTGPRSPGRLAPTAIFQRY